MRPFVVRHLHVSSFVGRGSLVSYTARPSDRRCSESWLGGAQRVSFLLEQRHRIIGLVPRQRVMSCETANKSNLIWAAICFLKGHV